MKRIPLDPWGNEYVYSNENNEFEVYSLGSDGEEGGEGVAEDIYSERNLIRNLSVCER